MAKLRNVQFLKDHVMFINGERCFFSCGFEWDNTIVPKSPDDPKFKKKKKYKIPNDIAIDLMDRGIVKDTRKK